MVHGNATDISSTDTTGVTIQHDVQHHRQARHLRLTDVYQFEPPPLYDITMLLFHSPFLPLLDGSVSESKRIAAMKKGLQDLEVIEEREKKKDIHT